jgi:hypothetical protein
VAEIAATGMTPVDFLVSVMRDETRPIELRIDAAGRVAPYVHPRLSAVDVAARDGRPLVVEIVRFGRDDEPGEQ